MSQGLAKLNGFLYDKIFKRTSTFVVFIGITAIFADRVVDTVGEGIWVKANEGRLWKDVKKQLNLEAPK